MEKYAEKVNLRHYMDQLLTDVLTERPDDLLGFIQHWATVRNRRPSSTGSLRVFQMGSQMGSQNSQSSAKHQHHDPLSLVPPIPMYNSAPSSSASRPLPSPGSASDHRGAVAVPLSPFQHRATPPNVNNSPLVPMSHRFSVDESERHAMMQSLRLDGSTAGDALIASMPDLILTTDDSFAGSPTVGQNFNNLGPSVLSPAGRVQRSALSVTNSSTGLPCVDRNGIVIHGADDDGGVEMCLQVDAAFPLPIRMPIAELPTLLSRQDKFSDFTPMGNAGDRLRCQRLADGKIVTIKMYDLSDRKDVHPADLLRDAFSLVAASRHPGCVQIFDAFMEAQTLCVVQEMLDNPITLRQYYTMVNLLNEQQMRNLISQVAQALHRMHYLGLPHGKVRVDNCFIIPGKDDIRKFTIKLGDFGAFTSQCDREDAFESDILDLGFMARMVMHSNAGEELVELVDDMCSKTARPTTTTILTLVASTNINTVLAATGIAVVMTDRAGKIIAWNPPAEALFGYAEAEVKDKNISIIMKPMIADAHDEWMAEYERTGVKRSLDQGQIVTCVAKGGAEISVEMRVAEHSARQFVANFRDVSAYKSLQFIHDLRQQHANIIDYIPVCTVCTNASGIITHFNRSASELFGYAPGFVVGRSINTLMPPEIAKHHDQYMSHCRQVSPPPMQDGLPITANPFAVQHPNSVLIKLRSGQMSVARMSVFHSQRHEENFTAYFTAENGISNDYNSVFGVVANMFQAGVVMIDEYGIIRRFSRMAEEILEHTEADVVGKNVRVLMETDIGDQHQEYIERYKRYGVGRVVGQVRVVKAVKPCGTPLHINLCVQPFHTLGHLYFVAFITSAVSTKMPMLEKAWPIEKSPTTSPLDSGRLSSGLVSPPPRRRSTLGRFLPPGDDTSVKLGSAAGSVATETPPLGDDGKGIDLPRQDSLPSAEASTATPSHEAKADALPLHRQDSL